MKKNLNKIYNITLFAMPFILITLILLTSNYAKIEELTITQISPTSIASGVKFQEFGGNSTMSIVGYKFMQGDTVYANKVPLNTSFGNEGFITAVVPEELYAKKGHIYVQIVRKDTDTSRIIARSRKVFVPIK